MARPSRSARPWVTWQRCCTNYAAHSTSVLRVRFFNCSFNTFDEIWANRHVWNHQEAKHRVYKLRVSRRRSHLGEVVDGVAIKGHELFTLL